MENPNLNPDNAGQFHNKQMTVYYGKLTELVKKLGHKNVKPEDTRKAFNDLLDSIYGPNNEKIISEAMKGYDTIYGKTNEEIADISINNIKNMPYKGEELKLFMIKLIEETKKLNFDTASNFFENKLREANSKFKDQDLEIAISGINTGKASYLYWSENFNDWFLLFNDAKSIPAQRRGGRTVGIADASGFISGAIWGGIGGTAFLPGVGTVAGALAVGTAYGLYGSIAGAVLSILNGFFGD